MQNASGGRKRTGQVGDAGLRRVERRVAKQCSHEGSAGARPVSAKGGWAKFDHLSYLLTVMEDQRVLLKSTHSCGFYFVFLALGLVK